MSFRHLFSDFIILVCSLVLMSCSGEASLVNTTNPDNPGTEQEKNPIEELELDGYAVFFQDKTSWGATHIYGWNADGGVTEKWPGNQVNGTVSINDVTYKYVDMGKALEGKTMKLIFNCNSSQNTQDGFEVTLNRNYFFKITDDSAEEIDPEKSEEAGDIFALSETEANFESLPKGGKSLTLSSKHYDWSVDFGKNDWIILLNDNGEKVSSGSKSNKAQYLTLCVEPNSNQQEREAKITFKAGDDSVIDFTVRQKAASKPLLSQWVFKDNKQTYSVSWPHMHIIGATDGTAGQITVVRGADNSEVPFVCKVIGNNPNVSTMVEGDYWLYTFDANVPAGSVVAFNATMAGDKKAPKYFIVEYFDGGQWKSSNEDLFQAKENSSLKYTYKLSGEVKTGSPDTYQYTTVMQTYNFENEVKDKLMIRCRVVGDMTCDGSKQDINMASNSACSLPDFGFTASDVQIYPDVAITETRKVLVIGNSFHYYFNPVFMLREIAWSQGVDLKITAHLKGSQSFEKHLVLSNTLEAIEKGGYDFAIIQDQSKNPARLADKPESYAKVRENCVALAELIRKYSPSCDIILDQTWAYPNSDNSFGGYGSYENFDKLLAAGTREMALAAGCRVAPVGMAFAQSRKEHSGWSLYFSGDGLHPTRTSAYLEACVEYVMITGRKFQSPTVDCKVSGERARYMRTLSENIVLDNPEIVHPE